ncbi:MAG: ABC transporter permease [Myxococcota bacterium]
MFVRQLGDTLMEIADALSATPGRSLLTMAGVFWGTLILLLMLGFAEALEQAAYRTIGQSVTNSVFVWGGRTRLGYAGLRPGRWVRYDLDDVPALERIPGVRHLSPRAHLGGYGHGLRVSHGTESGAFAITGEAPNFRHVQTVEWDAGRFLNQLDMAQKRKVAVIGRQVYRQLWPNGGNPIGQTIAILGIPFKVVGLFHIGSGDDEGDREERNIRVPLSTYLATFRQGNVVSAWAFVVEDGFTSETVEDDVKRVLAARHDVHPDDTVALGSFNAEREFGRVRDLFTGMRGLTWLVGLATLLSGAIGVSNVLLIMVRERTAEIGLRRAIGATPQMIVAMIGLEAMVMTGLAGMAGIVAGTGVLEVAAFIIGPDNSAMGQPYVHWSAAVGTALLLGFAGLVAGYLPAQRAVAIEPAGALRSE